MEVESFLETPCEVCGGTNYILEMGYYVCTECQMLSQSLREQVFEYNFASQTSEKTKNIKNNDTPIKSLRATDTGLTSWETFNYILKGYVDELLYLGASPKLKIMVLQLWAVYLRDSEVAFYNHKEGRMPKLAYNYYLHDASILYQTPHDIAKGHRIGKLGSNTCSKNSLFSSKFSTSSMGQTSDTDESISGLSKTSKKSKGKERKRKNYEEMYPSDVSMNQSRMSELSELEMSFSQTSNNDESDDMSSISLPTLNKASKQIIKNKQSIRSPSIAKSEKKSKSIQKKGGYLVKKELLLPLVYVALNILDDDIEISDLLRWSREHNISTYMLKNYLPEEELENSSSLRYYLSQYTVSYSEFASFSRKLCSSLGVGKNINGNNTEDLMKIVKRLLINMQLPDSLVKYIKRLLTNCPILTYLANPYSQELRAISLIIMTLKIIFGLDGVTEDHLSDITEKLNKKCVEKRDKFLFNWNNWVKFCECRKAVISKYHPPSYMHFNPNKSLDPNQYLSFMDNVKGLNENTTLKDLPKEYENFEIIFKENLHIKNDDKNEQVPQVHFPATLYPWKDYLNILLETPEISKDLPQILKHEHQKDNLDFIFKPQQFARYAQSLGYKIKYRKGSLQKNSMCIHIEETESYSTSTNDTEIIFKNTKAKPLMVTNEDIGSDSLSDDTLTEDNEDSQTLIIPLAFSDYWVLPMVKITRTNYLKNYLLEVHSKLPPSFRWLIDETAKLIDASPEMIYGDFAYLDQLYYEYVILKEEKDEDDNS